MKITVINTYENVKQYIKKVQSGGNVDECWEKEVVAPFWDNLCCYAPFDLSDRKPKAIKNLDKLKEQCDILQGLDVALLEKEFERVTTILPNYDEDPLQVVLFPNDAENTMVNEKQNGVVGTSLFGNLYIQVNPLIEEYDKWIYYVFAHEYHHTVWGNYWFMLHGEELENKFIDSLVIDGEADSFALELYPNLRPKWLFELTEDEVNQLWEQRYKDIITRTDVDYVTYMFGNEEAGIPWCAGYAVGFQLIQKYLKERKKSVIEILEVKPEKMLL